MKKEDIALLSKGHSASALYAVLDSLGKLGTPLDSFYKEGTLLAAHPPCGNKLGEIPFGTGSLGHGLSLACGLALSSKLSKSERKIYCILSDGDLNEGSTWEAFHFAVHHRLSNLTIFLDINGVQGLGFGKDILNLEPIEEKLKILGFGVATAMNGNSFSELYQADKDAVCDQAPRCIVARTTKGHGVSFMEGKMEWHYLTMSDEQFKVAVDEQ